MFGYVFFVELNDSQVDQCIPVQYQYMKYTFFTYDTSLNIINAY